MTLSDFLTGVDDCASPGANNCSSNADCVNEAGSFGCNCKPGYTGDGVNCNGTLRKDFTILDFLAFIPDDLKFAQNFTLYTENKHREFVAMTHDYAQHLRAQDLCHL